MGTSANKMVYPEGIFLWWGLFIPGFKTIAYVVDKQSYIWRRYLLLQGLCVPSVKTTTYVCNRFNTSFCARDHKTNQAISNLNRKFWNKLILIWVGFLGVHFYQLAPTRLLVWKTIPSFEFAYISCILYRRLLWPISVSTKNLSGRKKVHLKVFLNQ